MNAIDADIIDLMEKSVDLAESKYRALVIGNHGAEAFSAGANLMLIFLGIQQKDWKQIEGMASRLQAVGRRLHTAEVPVVAAPFGLTFGGGAEVAMACGGIQAHAELYMGLVEAGVGLIPAGGGCFSLLYNLSQGQLPDADPTAVLREAFMTIGTVRVGTGAEHSRKLGFLKANDRVTMDRDELIEAAKQRALGMANSDYAPSKPRRVRVAGTTGFATLFSGIWGMQETHQIPEHDAKIGRHLARILSGGDVAPGSWVDEERVHELEREAFLSLCGEEKTQARIQHMLMNNKPLRN
jgi:3-hydroxyacyl-CoA dehydrogenase